MSSTPSVPPRKPVAELQAGDRLDDQVFRIQQKDLRTTSNGGLYVHVVIADASGQMLARIWNASQELFDSLPDGGLAHFRGRVENYKGNRQFIVDGVRTVEPGAVDPAEFLPSSRHDRDALWNQVKDHLRQVRNRDLLALLAKFVQDEEFVTRFTRAPAAVQMHHAYVGGLVEHTRNLLRLALAVCPLYPEISQDLVLAGVFLHDAGKTAELAYETNFEYTNEGQLVGHIVLCTLWVHDHCRALEAETGRPFPHQLETVLKHLILSHHGKYEFGSPRLPATPEAFMIHYLDNLDAKLAMTFGAIAADSNAASDWTGYIHSLETRVFKPDVLGVRAAAPRGAAS